MKTRIRIAELNDASSFVAIKDQLPIKKTDGTTSTGGFLLGTDIATYEYYIENAFCLVAEVNDKIVGFGIIFNEVMLRSSDVWLRRKQANWFINLADWEDKKLCYFEQLAFLPGYRRLVILLSYNLVKWVFDLGYDALFTTTVKEPILNLAAIPFIYAVDGILAGNIREIYPKIGLINSDIYLIESECFYSKTKIHSLYPFFQNNLTLLIAQ